MLLLLHEFFIIQFHVHNCSFVLHVYPHESDVTRECGSLTCEKAALDFSLMANRECAVRHFAHPRIEAPDVFESAPPGPRAGELSTPEKGAEGLESGTGKGLVKRYTTLRSRRNLCRTTHNAQFDQVK